MRLIYNGPSRRIQASVDGEYVNQGQEIELPDAAIGVLRAAGHRFTAVDGRKSLPEPEPEAFEAPVEPEPDEPDEP